MVTAKHQMPAHFTASRTFPGAVLCIGANTPSNETIKVVAAEGTFSNLRRWASQQADKPLGDRSKLLAEGCILLNSANRASPCASRNKKRRQSQD